MTYKGNLQQIRKKGSNHPKITISAEVLLINFKIHALEISLRILMRFLY